MRLSRLSALVLPLTLTAMAAISGCSGDSAATAPVQAEADAAIDSPPAKPDSSVDSSMDSAIDSATEDTSVDSTVVDTSVDSTVVDSAEKDTALDVQTDTLADSSDGGCNVDSDCDDKLACTVDSCSAGACSHWAGPITGTTACSSGKVCDPKLGCVTGTACATTDQCKQQLGSDACKANIACNASSSVCQYTILDKDADGHPPVICGGDDCDDNNKAVHPGVVDACGAADKDCNGKPGTFCDPGAVCDKNVCSCSPENQCPTGCRDIKTDTSNCGTCSHPCGGGESCNNGTCECSGGSIVCGGKCVNPKTDIKNCGACGNTCSTANGASCGSGTCVCAAGQQKCGGSCAFLDSDFGNCGTCGKACSNGQVCSKGICTDLPGGVTEMATLPLKLGHFKMDKLEATIAQYNAWLSLNPSLAGAPSQCSANTYPAVKVCTECQLPVTKVDWCDAEAYCRSVGKRLCGRVQQYSLASHYGNSEFLVACKSSRGAGYEEPNVYTYGSWYSATTCATDTFGIVPVGSKTNCHSDRAEYSAVMDLSGNVKEWQDGCGTNGCVTRGGDFQSYGDCDEASAGPITVSSGLTGFRCCADAS